MSVRSFNLFDLLVRNAQVHGDRCAIVTEGGEKRSFSELLARVERLAAGLAQSGLESGDRLCILAQNSAAYLEVYFAAARLGVVTYPLNWRLKPEEIERLVDRAKPKAFMIDQSCRTTLGDSLDENANIGSWIAIDWTPDSSPGIQALETLYLTDTEALATLPSPEGDHPFTIIATAAVEIVPRGAVLSHDNLLWANIQEIAALGLGPDDGNLVALPLFHIAGLGHCLSFLHAGAKNVVMEKFDAEKAVELIDQHHLSHISDFPPILTSVLDAAKSSGSSLATLKHVSGLDSPDTMQRLLDETGADFWSGFGQTETSGFVTLQRFRDRPGAAGKASEVSRIRLVDEFDRDVEAGQPGEIAVRGPMVFLGYADEPEVTDHTLRNGWHHTGDIGRFDEDGYLYYVGRSPEKELIKPGGENVYPAEVETVIVEISGVTAACVFGVPHEKWGEGIKAVVEVQEGVQVDAETVIRHVGDRIARYKKPHFVDFTHQIPRNENGSIDREQVKQTWKP